MSITVLCLPEHSDQTGTGAKFGLVLVILGCHGDLHTYTGWESEQDLAAKQGKKNIRTTETEFTTRGAGSLW